jgi:hypothetical protein
MPGESSITLDYFQGSVAGVNAQSSTELPPGQTVRAVLAYSHGPWAPDDLTSTVGTLHRDGTNRTYRTRFEWRLPSDFATSFDVRAEIQRVFNSRVHRPLPLSTNSVLEIFSLTNKDGQMISGGLQFEKESVTNPESAFATLGNFSGNLSGQGDGHSYFDGRFSANVPSGFRVETFYTFNGEVRNGTASPSEDGRVLTMRWRDLSSEALRLPEQLREKGAIRVPTNGPVEIFALTNIHSERPRYALDPLPNRDLTNVIRGIVQLVPIPVNGRAITE